MKKLSLILAFVTLYVLAGEVTAQQNNTVFGLESWAGYTSNGTVPFWLRSNQFGSVPLEGTSFSLIGYVRKDYDSGKGKLFDWGGSFEGRANLVQGSNLTLVEGYGKIRLGIFELRAGRSKNITGLCDTLLTSGSWALSGNSLGIPAVEFSVREFWTIPMLGELIALKGNFVNGWVGDLEMARYILQDTVTITSYFHQKSLYGRFGKPSWRMKFYGGFNHQVIWGHEQEYYLDNYTLKPFQTYLYMFIGKRYSNGYIQEERQGNHLGSIDLGMEYRFDKYKISLYRQNFYEVGGLGHLANIQDGLNGLSIENLSGKETEKIWKKILVEFLYTKNQAGRPWSPEYGSPYEPYYNHGQYVTGWSFKDAGLGTPFISNRSYLRGNLPTHPENYFVNNRVIMFHVGGEGTVKGVNYILKASWSKNYGTYHTTDEEQSTGILDPGSYGIFGEQRQFSGYIEMNKTFINNIGVGLVGAADIGELFHNSGAIFLKFAYGFN